MKPSRFVVPALLGLMALSSARASHADSIGINFTDAPNSGPGTGLTSLAPTTSAGVVAQTNWNNFNGNVSGGRGAPTSIFDNSGQLTTMKMTYLAGRAGIFNSSGTVVGDEQLNNGGLFSFAQPDANSAPITITLSNIPYATYRIYVYNLAALDAEQEIKVGSSTFFTRSPDPTARGYLDNDPTTPYRYTFNDRLRGTSTYVSFGGLSSTSQTVTVTGLDGAFAHIGAIQLVNTSPVTVATPEPSTYAMMALGLVALCVLGAKRKKDGQAI